MQNKDKVLLNLLVVSRYLVLVGAGLFVCVYLILAFYRLPYKFELEWLEGGSVDHVRKILSGQPPYGPPSLEFTPYEYTPLYYYVSALVARFTGIGFLPLRLVSMGSSLASMCLIFLMVRRETQSSTAALLAACLMAASFRKTGAWFDVARVDCLFLFLVLSAVYVARFSASFRGCILGGLLVGCAFLTKQSAAVVLCPLMIYLLFFKPRYGMVWVVVGGVTIVLATVVLEVATGGWYLYYTCHVAGAINTIGHNSLGYYTRFWLVDILPDFSIACSLGVLYLMGRYYSDDVGSFVFYLLMVAGMLAGSWYSRLNWGGYDNVLLPACAAVSISFGLGIASAVRVVKCSVTDTSIRTMAETFIFLMIASQYCALLYNPIPKVPKQRDVRAGEAFIAVLAEFQGDVLLLSHGYLVGLAGKSTYAELEALGAVLRCRDSVAEKLAKEIDADVRRQRFSAVILDEEWAACPGFQEALGAFYTRVDGLFESKEVFYPIVGGGYRPEMLYVPRVAEEERNSN